MYVGLIIIQNWTPFLLKIPGGQTFYIPERIFSGRIHGGTQIQGKDAGCLRRVCPGLPTVAEARHEGLGRCSVGDGSVCWQQGVKRRGWGTQDMGGTSRRSSLQLRLPVLPLPTTRNEHRPSLTWRLISYWNERSEPLQWYNQFHPFYHSFFSSDIEKQHGLLRRICSHSILICCADILWACFSPSLKAWTALTLHSCHPAESL